MIPELTYRKIVPDYVYDAVVARWVDGDTVALDCFVAVDFGFHNYQISQFKLTFRIKGVDTPESWEEGYEEANAFAEHTAPVGTQLTIKTYKMPTSYSPSGSFGRYICDIYLGSGETYTEVVIASGHGEIDTRG